MLSGRTALVDLGGAHGRPYQRLGIPNMNVFTGLPSVQGYGSLISTIYDNLTGTHPQATVDPCRLADGTFVQLRLGAIVVASIQLSQNIRQITPPVPNCTMAKPSERADRYFGQILRVHTVRLHGRGGQPVSSGPVYFHLLDWNGRGVGPVIVERGANIMTFTVKGRSPRAAGFELTAKRLISIGDTLVTETDPALPTYRLDSPFQEALDRLNWRLSDTVGTFSVFKTTDVAPPEWLVAPSRGSSLSHVHSAAWGDSWASVQTTAPVTLVRSTAYLPGWRATALNITTGRSVELTVRRSGLIQQVLVPRGAWTIHFHYHAPYIELGLASSLGGGLLFIAVLGYLVVSDRRRRDDKVRT